MLRFYLRKGACMRRLGPQAHACEAVLLDLGSFFVGTRALGTGFGSPSARCDTFSIEAFIVLVESGKVS